MKKKYWEVSTADGCGEKVVLAHSFEGTYEEAISKFVKKAYVHLHVYETNKPKVRPNPRIQREARSITVSVHGKYPYKTIFEDEVEV
jgi:hypothetical protein